MNTNTKLPDWPVEFVDDPGWSTSLHFASAYEHEKARADAAMARLRVAVEALQKLNHPDSVCKFYAAEAINLIGPLPKSEAERE